MFTEELTIIKEAELQAEMLRKDAKTEAKFMIERTNTNAGNILVEAEQKAKVYEETQIAEAQKIAKQQYEEAMMRTEKEWLIMKEKAGKKQDQVVKFIAERIVKSSVNC